MQGLKLWIYAARPKTLTIGLAPILIGTSLAISERVFHLDVFLWAILGAMMIQIGTNYSNDYFDFIKGADSKDRKGFKKVLEAGFTTKKAMKTAFVLCFFLAAISSIALSLRGGQVILIIGALCILFSILYTAGPFPLAYVGLGDIFVLIFYGPIATLFTYYLQTLQFNVGTLLASLAPGLLGVCVITVNNIRDVETDQKVNKKTLPVRFGKLFGQIQYMVMMTLTFFVPIIYVLHAKKHYLCLLACISLLPSFFLIKQVFNHRKNEELNQTLANTAKLIVPYTLLFCFGTLI